jgi:transposase InsO family protein
MSAKRHRGTRRRRTPPPATAWRTDRRRRRSWKKELMHGRSWAAKAELRTEVFEYIEVFFNRRRRRSALGRLSPVAFEIDHDQQTENIKLAATVAA